MPSATASPATVVILVTCPNREIAERIGHTLVEERLAACVSLVPGLLSIYRWEGKVCRDAEILLLIKTRRHRFAALARRVAALHPYSVPEILALPVRAGSRRYLEWVGESVSNLSTARPRRKPKA